MEDPRLLPPEAQVRLQEKREKHADTGVARAVADYIAGMTDRYAIKEYQRTCNPEEPS
jgi:dGTPase